MAIKVAYILHDTDQYGGAYKSFLPMLHALIDKGIEPLVVVPNNRGVAKDLKEKGIPTLVLSYRLNTYPYEESIKDYLLWIPRLIARRYVNAKATRQLVKKIRDFDLIHSNSSVVDIGSRAAKQIGIPHIYHFRENTDLIGMRYYPCKDSFYKTATNSICITKGVQKHHRLSNNSAVIYDCIIEDENKIKFPTTGTKDYLFFAGRLEHNKGIEELIDAYTHSNKLLPLWVAGAALEESYLEMLKKETNEFGIEDKIKFLGARTDVLKLMAGARATIVPSYNEGFGRIMPEAMFAQCLVIGRNTTGTREQFDNGFQLTGKEIGLRFNTREELTDAINRVCTADISEWDEYIERAYTTVNTLYTQEACSTAVMDYYNKILKA